jgi:hypothetical protein
MVALLSIIAAPRAAADERITLDDLEIFAVQDGEPAQILFSAPSGLAARTLTADDLDVRVDGAPQPARLQHLSADDLEIAVVIDTTMDAIGLRDLQAAVVELALTLPQGVTMRLVDAAGTVSNGAEVPGPAIAAIRALRPDTNDDIAAAVEQATTLLDGSSPARSALLVVGRDLTTRVDVVDERPLQSLSYLVSVGGGDAADLLGPRAGGEGVTVGNGGEVLAVTDDIARDLNSLYIAEISVPEGSTRTVTFALETEEGGSRPVTLALNPDSLRPAPAAPADRERPDTDAAAQPDTETREEPVSGNAPGDGAARETGGWLPWLLGIGALIAVIAAMAYLLSRVLRPSTPAEVEPLPPALPMGRRYRRGDQSPSPPQRPIAKLAPETRQALAGAYRGLRRLAVASRDAVGIVPDDLFRLTEACASAALSGHDQQLNAVLYAALSPDAGDTDSSMVERAAAALSQGWQHTARKEAAPPAVLEINASLRGTGRDRHEADPVAPVRALDPLVEIGLEHMVLAAKPDDHAGLAARAVTAVNVMRAARLAQPVLALSPSLLTDVERYRAACRGDPADADDRDDWLQFLFDGIARRSYVAVDQLGHLQRLRLRWRHAAPDQLSARLVDLLLTQPVVDTPLVARRLAVPESHAEAVMARAEAARWLEPYADDDRVLVAEGVMDAFTPVDTTADSHYYA